jgi:hypothetical protein
LCSCTAQGEPQERQPITAAQVQELAKKEKALGHNEQAQLMEDGKVTLEDYSSAFDLLSQCLSSDGVKTTDPVTDPVSGDRFAFSYDFAGIKPDVAIRAIDNCEASYWKSVSLAYSSGVSQRMDPRIAAATTTCLQEKGLPVPPSANSVPDFAGVLDKDDIEVMKMCIQDSVAEFFPELTSFTIGY